MKPQTNLVERRSREQNPMVLRRGWSVPAYLLILGFETAMERGMKLLHKRMLKKTGVRR